MRRAVFACLAASVSVGGSAMAQGPIPEPIPFGDIAVSLEPVSTGLVAPNWGTHAPCAERADQLFVTDQVGEIAVIDLVAGTTTPFLDVSARLVPLGIGGPGTFDERGLLGVAFHPDFATNGLLYTYTSEPVDGPADFSTIPDGESADHQAVIAEWEVPAPCDPTSVVDPSSVRVLLRVDEPQFNHDGGALTFGPEGQLFISLGDGGGGNDVGMGHSPEGNGQDPSNVLGTLLRIDPLGTNAANGAYGIPADNPFVGMVGFVDEIFAYGLRNAFRFSFDSATGDLFIGDVGQNNIEELNRNPFTAGAFEDVGANYGWREREGTFCFDPDTGEVSVCPPDPAMVDPIAEYDHDEGISIIGGFVYHGTDVPALDGLYVFGDYSLTFFGNDGRLFYLDATDEIKELQLLGDFAGGLGLSVLGLGQDAAGEVYLMGNRTGVPSGDTGVVLKITLPEVLEDPIPGPIPTGDVAIALNEVVGGLTAPNWGTSAPCAERASQLFITDQSGTIWVINLANRTRFPFLDVSDRLVPLGIGGPDTFDERGLLGLAFHPDFAINGLFYTYTSQPVDGPADFSTIPEGETADHQSVITEWRLDHPCVVTGLPDPSSDRVLLRIDQPQFNHDGGAIAFGPDGQLYIALGDGGGGSDLGAGHSPQGNGLDPSNVLGSILRIDPLGTDSASGQYGVPADNPFVGVSGFVDEIFVYGARNPFRFSFDTLTGDMYIGDVGQGEIEEVNRNVYDDVAGAFVDAGANYGWRSKEGTFCFDVNTTGVFECAPTGFVDPIAEYDHDEGISVIGGFVYRGADVPDLSGRYVFGDYSQTFFGNDGRLFYLGDGDEIFELQPTTAAGSGVGYSVLGFAQDAAGEVYLLANLTGIPFGDTGVVLKLDGEAEVSTDEPSVTPIANRLAAARPNPFRGSTAIGFELASAGQVHLSIFDVSGRRVVDLVDAPMTAGRHRLEWTGRDADGVAMANGTYFYRLRANGFESTRSMTLVR